ncbi:MAG TPA: transcription termination factor NusA [Spirochaetota bacterium]|nr:transcription termination factor NusA [Spirochaetota bacterium]
MKELNLKAAIDNISLKNSIAKDSIISMLTDVLTDEFADFFEVSEENIKIVFDEEQNLHIYLVKEVTEEVTDDCIEISPEQAQQINKDSRPGDSIDIEININELNRQDIKRLNSILLYKLKNIHKEILFHEYKAKEGQLINGTFIRRNRRDMFIDLGNTEGRLPYREQNPKEFYKQGDKVKTYIKEVILDENNRLSIILSRVDPEMVRKLFELEVPEINDGAVKIKTIVREPGKKVKMSVYSTKSGVEPVGACVGLSGIRIKAVIKELSGERIDVIPYNTNIHEFLARAMQPAEVSKVLIINEEEKECLIVVEDESYPKAIGSGGSNIKLASRLTDWTITVKTESQIQKHPEILQLFSKAEELFTNTETDFHQLKEIDEEILVKLMNAGIMNISDLYEKTTEQIAAIEGIAKEDARNIRKTLDDLVEIVEDEEEAKASREEYMSEFEDEIEGVDTDEEIKEEIQQVEYLTCPACDFEFKYENQNSCPNCGVEFEFEEE